MIAALIRAWRERRHPFTRRLGIRGAREYIALSPAFSDALRQRAQACVAARPMQFSDHELEDGARRHDRRAA